MIRNILIFIAVFSWGTAAAISLTEGLAYAEQDRMANFYCHVGKTQMARSHSAEVKRSFALYSSATNVGSCLIEAVDRFTKEEFTVTVNSSSNGVLIKDSRYRNVIVASL